MANGMVAMTRPAWPRLLASVRDEEEAAIALAVGVDVLDLKDPERGSLGPCAPSLLRAVAAARADAAAAGTAPVPLSAALGDAPRRGRSAALAAELAAAGAGFLKVGLLGIVSPDEARPCLEEIADAARRASSSVRVVAATFADDPRALPPDDLAGLASAADLDGCLLDTLRKTGPSLLERLGAERLTRFVADCRARGLSAALAGSLTASDASALRATGADFVGARGALCSGGRGGRLDAERVAAFRRALRGGAPR